MMCFRCVLFSIFSVDKDSENLRSSRLHIGNQTLFLLVILPIEQLSFLPLSQSLQSFPVRLSGLDLPPQALPETLRFSCMCAKPCCNDQAEIAPCKLKAQKETIPTSSIPTEIATKFPSPLRFLEGIAPRPPGPVPSGC